jgi:hypothetical protein
MSHSISYSPLPENLDEGVSQALDPKKFITTLFYSSYLMVIILFLLFIFILT